MAPSFSEMSIQMTSTAMNSVNAGNDKYHYSPSGWLILVMGVFRECRSL
jgi:hypothetical protein